MHQTLVVGTLQQNDRVEYKHLHILNVAHALHFQANISKRFWEKCVLTACYLINLTPSALLTEKTPFDLVRGQSLSYSDFKIFECLPYARDHCLPKDKFRTRSQPCIFLGYVFGKKGGACMILRARNSSFLRM